MSIPSYSNDIPTNSPRSPLSHKTCHDFAGSCLLFPLSDKDAADFIKSVGNSFRTALDSHEMLWQSFSRAVRAASEQLQQLQQL